MEPKLLPNVDKFRYQLPKGHFLFGTVIPNGFWWFLRYIASKMRAQRNPNPSRNWIRNGRPLESDFYDIMMDFGPQNGTPNLLKSYLKTGPKKGLQKNGLWRRPGASWRRLGAQKSTGSARGGGGAAATPGLSGRIRMYISLVYTEKKECWEGYEKERKMRRNIRVKELHTPCAGHRPGAADPKRSKAAYPPPPPRLSRK